LIGGLLQVVAHLIALRRYNLLKILYVGYLYSKKTKNRLRLFYRTFYSAILGNSAIQFSAFLDTWLASFLSAGSISYLYYANRVFQLPLALFAIALSVGVFPKITKEIKNRR